MARRGRGGRGRRDRGAEDNVPFDVDREVVTRAARRRPPRRPGGASRPPRREPQRKKRSRGSELRNRILVAIPLIALAIFLILQGGLIFSLGMVVLGLLGLHELYKLLEPTRPVKVAGFAAMIGLIAAAHWGGQFQILLVAVALVPVMFILVMVRGHLEGSTMAMAATMFGVWWLGFGFAHAVMLRELPHGDGVVVAVLVGTFIGDTAAYLGGRMFGATPLAPSISPNKTLEGLLIGMVMAVAAVWFTGLYQDWITGLQALLLGVVVAIIAPLGDLFESQVKRDAATKDTSRVFGAHGGVLDRLDAALFAIVAGFYVWSAML
jgi:phosphatidate cytidylyltransferase